MVHKEEGQIQKGAQAGQTSEEKEPMSGEEAENDWATNGPVEVGKCEFCDEPFEDCECGDGE